MLIVAAKEILLTSWVYAFGRSRHSGLDPESIVFSGSYNPGCRIKSGMTKKLPDPSTQ
jgi:hypothetical protein